MQKQIQKIIKELSIKYELPDYVIEAIITSQFKFLRESIKRDDLPTILLHKLGKFTLSQNKLKNFLKTNILYSLEQSNETNKDQSNPTS